MTHLDTGKVQIYTGDGKGKTTAAWVWHLERPATASTF